MKYKNLTQQEIEFLQNELYEDEESIEQIDYTLPKILVKKETEIADRLVVVRITLQQAKELLSFADFLSGVDRCVFHRTALRTVDSKTKIYFENSIW